MSKKTDTLYEDVYKRLRGVTSKSIKDSDGDPEAPFTIACAQTEALVRTLRGFTLRAVPKEKHAEYLNWFMGEFLKDVTERMPHIRANVIVREVKPKRKRRKSV